MGRVQLALNVSDLEQAVDFYTRLFATEPAKRRPGYANFAIEEPPLKLILFEAPGKGATINHLGVEVSSPDEVAEHTERLAAAGFPVKTEDGVDCCYAVQDKVWVTDPDGASWEYYTVLENTETCASTGCDDAACNDAACTDGVRSTAGCC